MSKKYINKKVEVNKRVLDGVICDTCNKEIKEGLYFEVTTGHHRWGNDSVESIEEFDYCSKDCLDVAYDEYYEKMFETCYFNIDVEEL